MKNYLLFKDGEARWTSHDQLIMQGQQSSPHANVAYPRLNTGLISWSRPPVTLELREQQHKDNNNNNNNNDTCKNSLIRKMWI